MFCYFTSDLHGHKSRYEKLFNLIIQEPPQIVFLTGDLLSRLSPQSFLLEYIVPNLKRMRNILSERYPQIYLILGNNDERIYEEIIENISKETLWNYIHLKKIKSGNYNIYGYNYSPPTPFLLKDWEKYDTNYEIKKGCISPEMGKRTVEISDEEKLSTIQNDLEKLANNENHSNSIFLFHAPPYKTNLDKIGSSIESDSHVGSIAIRKFIEQKQPYLTLHGHIHESTRITGKWKDKIGRTICFNGAHDGEELSIIKFHIDNLENAERILIRPGF